MLERLHFILGGCVGEGTQDSGCIVALNYHGESLEEEGALAVVVCALCYIVLLLLLLFSG